LGQIRFPLLGNITEEIGRDYGVLLHEGITLRELFIIDPEGNVAFEVVHDLGIGRNTNEVLRVAPSHSKHAPDR